MHRSNKPFSVSQFLSLLLLSLLLSACASTPDSSDSAKAAPPSAFSQLDQKPDWYLQQLAQADASYRFTWELLAARSLIAAGDLQQASAISQQLAKEAFTPRQKDEQRLVAALLLQRQGKVEPALDLLTKVDKRPLAADAMAVYYSLQASLLSQTDTPLNALSAYVALENYLPAKERKPPRSCNRPSSNPRRTSVAAGWSWPSCNKPWGKTRNNLPPSLPSGSNSTQTTRPMSCSNNRWPPKSQPVTRMRP